MRGLILVSCLILGAIARPQSTESTSTSASISTSTDWKSIDKEPKAPSLRYSRQFQELSNFFRDFVPFSSSRVTERAITTTERNRFNFHGRLKIIPTTKRNRNNEQGKQTTAQNPINIKTTTEHSIIKNTTPRNRVKIKTTTERNNVKNQVKNTTPRKRIRTTTVAPRRKVQISYKIANITSIKDQAQKNKLKPNNPNNIKIRNKFRNSTNPNHKHWPDSAIQSEHDLTNYNQYISNLSSTSPAPRKKKPQIQHFFTKISDRPVSNNNTKWFEIKVKQPIPTSQTIHTSTNSLPIDVIENSNPFPVKIPGSSTFNNQDELSVHIPPINIPSVNIPNINEIIANNNKVQIGTTVHLTPEFEIDEDSEIRPAGGAPNPCPAITITSNTIYNKEICPDLDIVINNHFQSNTNIITDPPILDEPVEYDAVNSEEEDLIEEEPVEEDEYPEIIEEPIEDSGLQAEEEVIAEDGLGESAASSGQETVSQSSGNRPQLPNLPGLPQNDNNNNNDNEGENEGLLDTGLSVLGLLNPFNYPLISLVVAPLALILTGTLGLTTFFIPWAIFPTVFLSRSAKKIQFANDSKKPLARPDGWFWHTNYKTWASFTNNKTKDNSHEESDRAFHINSLSSFVSRLIEEFEKAYNLDNTPKFWKRRKKT